MLGILELGLSITETDSMPLLSNNTLEYLLKELPISRLVDAFAGYKHDLVLLPSLIHKRKQTYFNKKLQ